MAKKRLLVIDASVARSAGGREHTQSKVCTDVLDIMRDREKEPIFMIVMTPDIRIEWQKHQSSYASTWLTAMIARKKLIAFKADVVISPALRAQIEQAAKSQKDEREMLKDVHLLEAALAADQVIISLNEIDRKRFQGICADVREIRAILWVNPLIAEEKCLEWMHNAAPPEPHRQLGYVPT